MKFLFPTHSPMARQLIMQRPWLWCITAVMLIGVGIACILGFFAFNALASAEVRGMHRTYATIVNPNVALPADADLSNLQRLRWENNATQIEFEAGGETRQSMVGTMANRRQGEQIVIFYNPQTFGNIIVQEGRAFVTESNVLILGVVVLPIGIWMLKMFIKIKKTPAQRVTIQRPGLAGGRHKGRA